MDIEQAKKITSLCVEAFMSRLVGGDLSHPRELEKLTLADLLEANHLVRDLPPKRDGNQTIIACHCDDRAIAALYVALNYDGQLHEDFMQHPEPITRIGRSCLCVIELPEDYDPR